LAATPQGYAQKELYFVYKTFYSKALNHLFISKTLCSHYALNAKEEAFAEEASALFMQKARQSLKLRRCLKKLISLAQALPHLLAIMATRMLMLEY